VQSVYIVASGQLCATTRRDGLVFISTDVFDEPATETLDNVWNQKLFFSACSLVQP
jgi:hypothetical protein